MEHIDKSFGCSGEIPELTAVGQDWQADSVEHQSPVGHRQALNGVAKYLERLHGCTCSVAHDTNVGLPFKPAVNEEPEVSQVLRWLHHVICGVLPIWKDQLQGSRERVALVRLLEEQQFGLLWLNCQT